MNLFKTTLRDEPLIASPFPLLSYYSYPRASTTSHPNSFIPHKGGRRTSEVHTTFYLVQICKTNAMA